MKRVITNSACSARNNARVDLRKPFLAGLRPVPACCRMFIVNPAPARSPALRGASQGPHEKERTPGRLYRVAVLIEFEQAGHIQLTVRDASLDLFTR